MFEGVVVSIWFFNTKPGALGYDAGKALALSKITKIHGDVKTGKLTIKKAGDNIKNDSSLAGVDPVYKLNAYTEFRVNASEPITFDPGFNSVLRGLGPGEVSDLYLAKDKNLETGEVVDAVYMFGQVKNTINNSSESFNDWLADQEKHYEITYY